jgi:hypothetical protein
LEETIMLRFCEGNPKSAFTEQFLAWCCERLERRGARVFVLIWDNAPWHDSHRVRAWIRTHNWTVKRTGCGVRVLAVLLPTRSPWLNPIEPHWLHGKRRIAEPTRLLSPDELLDRVCATFHCAHEPHMIIPQNVA